MSEIQWTLDPTNGQIVSCTCLNKQHNPVHRPEQKLSEEEQIPTQIANAMISSSCGKYCWHRPFGPGISTDALSRIPFITGLEGFRWASQLGLKLAMLWSICLWVVTIDWVWHHFHVRWVEYVPVASMRYYPLLALLRLTRYRNRKTRHSTFKIRVYIHRLNWIC